MIILHFRGFSLLITALAVVDVSISHSKKLELRSVVIQYWLPIKYWNSRKIAGTSGGSIWNGEKRLGKWNCITFITKFIMKVSDHLEYMHVHKHFKSAGLQVKKITVFHPENHPYFWFLQLFYFCNTAATCMVLFALHCTDALRLSARHKISTSSSFLSILQTSKVL